MRVWGENGCGHDPVVNVCPQTWCASARSGASAAATNDPPTRATKPLPTRPMNDRRLVRAASEIVVRSIAS
jgi:hypothetical protein